ncbi:MAG: hypothetical protein K0B37_13945 [Bacteroidales bacterium]|nr:hypothetical protein [Bacteroidales bacterium]
MFGPVGATAGKILFLAGLVITWFYVSGLILVLIGAFVGFTSTITWIDFDKKRLRFATRLFGFIPTGKWIFVHKDMKLGIKKSNQVWRAYSRGNQTLDIADNDYVLFLFDANGKAIIPIQKSSTPDAAKQNLDTLTKHLGIGVI